MALNSTYYSEMFECSQTGTVRLTRLSSSGENMGRVELCYDGHWGSVCDDNSNNIIANVVCRQLGYEGRGQSIFPF